MMSEKKRVEWIDVAKGVGMILVIMGHCFNKETLLHNWIFSFHMPLFFVLSGYCFNLRKYENAWSLIKEKNQTLIFPFVKFWILGLTVTLIIEEWRSDFSWKQLLIDMYSGYPSSLHITSTWYLIALFMCALVFYIIVKLGEWIKNKYFLWFCIVLSGIMGYLVSVVKSIVYDSSAGQMEGSASTSTFLPGNRLPLTLDTCMTALVFFAIGYCLREFGIKYVERNKKVTEGLILFLVNIIVSLGLNTRVNLHGCSYGNAVYFYLAALAGTFAVFYFAQIICSSKIKWMSQIKKCFVFYGRHSLLMLGMQSLGINLFVYALSEINHQEYILYETVPVTAGVMAFVLITMIFLPVTKWLNERLPKGIKI